MKHDESVRTLIFCNGRRCGVGIGANCSDESTFGVRGGGTFGNFHGPSYVAENMDLILQLAHQKCPVGLGPKSLNIFQKCVYTSVFILKTEI